MPERAGHLYVSSHVNELEVTTIVYAELLKVVGGAAVVIAALSAFLGRIWAERIARREAHVLDEKLAAMKAAFEREHSELKAHLDVSGQRRILVDRVQFEHEYEIYKQAWAALFALKQVTLQLRPMLDHIDPSESREDRMKRRIGDFVKPFNSYLEIVEVNKPFYPESVYVALADVREKCREEVIDFEYVDRPHKDYWAEARKNQKEILDSIERACLAIRTRISEVRVE